MQYLNILYFLILTGLGYRYLLGDGKVLKGALNPNLNFKYSGVEIFWCLTFATGVVALSADVGLDLMAIRLLVLEVFCIIGISIAKGKVVLNFPMKIYIIYLLWLVIGLFYSPSLTYGIRTILKYIYPFLLCLFASSAVTDSEVFFKSSKWARIVALISVIFSFLPYIGIVIPMPGFFWYVTARAINYISIMIFSLGMFFFSNRKKENLIWTFVFLAPCILWVFRTSILGSTIAIMAFFGIKYRIKALPIMFGIFVLAVVAVFTIPSIREKMFYDDNVTIEDFQQGKISEDNVNTNYRAYMWEKLENKFYKGHEIFGSGTGAVQDEMYNHRFEYGGLIVPHSDFVQQKCDNGLIGLILYGAIIFFIFVDCFRTYKKKVFAAPIRLCALVAGASVLGVYATFYSDNTVNYSMATLAMPFGFYGMMLGMRNAAKNGKKV